MTDAVIHFRGKGDEQRDFPALPRCNDLLDDGGQLWRVAVVVFGATVDVYVTRLGDVLAAETRGEWERWAEVADSADPATKEQTEMFA